MSGSDERFGAGRDDEPTGEILHAVPQPGQILSGRYVLESQLGQGGMGWVWRARDRELGRDVALKILLPSLARQPDLLERFSREARAIAALDHESVVPVYDVGRDGRFSYFVMKLLSGQPLHLILEQGPLPIALAIDLCCQVLDGLGHLHERGLVHRDIKPGNVIVSEDGRATIVDFGILRGPAHEPRMTAAGLFVGTPEYVAPELVRSAPGEPRTDLYSLGVTLYEMLTGDVPFSGETPIEIVTRHLRDPAPRPSSVRVGIPRFLDEVVLRALSKNPADRFASASQMRLALEEARESLGRPQGSDSTRMPTQVLAAPRRRWRRAGAGALLGAVAIAVLVALVWPSAETPRLSAVARTPRMADLTIAARPAPARAQIATPAGVPAPPAAIPATGDPTPPAAEAAAVAPAAPEPAGRAPRPASRRTSSAGRAPAAPRQARPTAPIAAPAKEPASATGTTMERARAALRNGAASQAVALFQQASREHASSPAAFRGLGDAFLAIGNRTAAIAAYRRCLALGPNARDRTAVEQRLERLGAR